MNNEPIICAAGQIEEPIDYAEPLSGVEPVPDGVWWHQAYNEFYGGEAGSDRITEDYERFRAKWISRRSEFPQSREAAEARMREKQEPIPEGAYYWTERNVFCDKDRRNCCGLGNQFHQKWWSRREEFPKSMECSVCHGSGAQQSQPSPAPVSAEAEKSGDVMAYIDDLRDMGDSLHNPKHQLADRIKEEFERQADEINSLKSHVRHQQGQIECYEKEAATLKSKLDSQWEYLRMCERKHVEQAAEIERLKSELAESYVNNAKEYQRGRDSEKAESVWLSGKLHESREQQSKLQAEVERLRAELSADRTPIADFEKEIEAVQRDVMWGSKSEIGDAIRKHIGPLIPQGQRFEGWCYMLGDHPFDGYLYETKRGLHNTPCTIYVRKESQ